MELHRCRFVQYQPSPIHHIAAPPAQVSEYFPLIAVARANGDIELWNTQLHPHALSQSLDLSATGRPNRNSHWLCAARIATGCSIEALAFAVTSTKQHSNDESDSDSGEDDEQEEEVLMQSTTANPTKTKSTYKPSTNVNATACKLRLFAASLDGVITEYDLDTLSIRQQVDSHGGGAVWRLAVSPNQQRLAVACEDGCIRLYRLSGGAADGGIIEYERSTDKHAGRIVSVVWTGDGRRLVSGGSDGLIRVWDATSGRAVQRMRVATRTKEEVIIWDLLYLSHGNLIISADSLGGIKFWDGHTFTLLQSFQPYENDVLALAINLNGDQIFAAGIDGRLTMLQRVNYKWSVVQQRRIHMNDIRSLVWVQKYAAPTAKPAASSTNHGGGKRSRGDADDDSDNHQDGDTQKRNKQQLMVDVLISGGVDTYLTLQVEPTQRFSSSRSHQFQQPVRIPPFPTPRQQQQPMVRVCAKQRLLVSYQADTVSIWRLGRPSRTVDSGTDLIPIVGGGGEFLAQIKLRAGRHVQFIDIDRNGQYLAVGDGNGCLSVYELALNSSPAATSTLLLRNITRRLPDMLPAVQLATFAGHYLVVACHGGMVYIFDNVESEFRLKRSWLVGGKVATGDDNSASPIAYLCADDEQFVVCGDLMNRVSVLNTQSGDITELPAVQGGLYTCMSLIRLPEPHLLIAMASMRPSDSSSRAKSAEGGRARYKNRILFYDLTRMRFNGAVESALAQIEWLGSRREKITGITSAVCDDPSTGSTSPSLFIHCPQWIGRVDLSKAVEYAGKLAETKEKSARGALKTSLESTWSACSEFDNILHFSLLSSSASASSSSLEAVVVERPWSSIVEDMPAPVYVKQYGQ